jgi:hypothetical protein
MLETPVETKLPVLMKRHVLWKYEKQAMVLIYP